MQDRENRQTVSLERQDSGPTFEDGIWFAIQLLVTGPGFDEPTLAEWIAFEAGFTGSQMRTLQRRTGFQNRKMNRFIRDYIDKHKENKPETPKCLISQTINHA